LTRTHYAWRIWKTKPSGCACILIIRPHDHLCDNRKSHPCDIFLVNNGTAFTDQLDIKLERRRLDPFGPMPQKRNILMTGTRIQSVAYDQIRSDPLQATYLQVPLTIDRQRLPVRFSS
jgi:hypothetical protein